MLRLSDLRFRYRPSAPWAVDGVSMEVAPGEVVGLLGPNGAGKSTLMALIAGLRTPDTGSIERHPAAAERGGFALVPQDHGFYPMLTCRENLAVFGGVLGLRGLALRAAIDAAIDATGLSGVALRRASECSGGLKRRLNLAIGLLGRPRLLLLDEPTVGVDPQSRAFLLETVRGLRADGRAVIYASHYMEEVQQVADRVAVIDHGRLLRCGPLTRLLATATARLRLSLGAPLPEPLRARLAAEFGLVPNGAGDGPIELALPPGRSPEEVLRLLREAAVPVSAIQSGCRDLEDLFLELTHRSLRD